MKYLNAQAILSNDLVKELQKYIQGGYTSMFLLFMQNNGVKSQAIAEN